MQGVCRLHDGCFLGVGELCDPQLLLEHVHPVRFLLVELLQHEVLLDNPVMLSCQQARDSRGLPLDVVDSLPKNGGLDIFYNAVILQLELPRLLQKVKLLAHLVRSDAAADVACRVQRVSSITAAPIILRRKRGREGSLIPSEAICAHAANSLFIYGLLLRWLILMLLALPFPIILTIVVKTVYGAVGQVVHRVFLVGRAAQVGRLQARTVHTAQLGRVPPGRLLRCCLLGRP